MSSNSDFDPVLFFCDHCQSQGAMTKFHGGITPPPNDWIEYNGTTGHLCPSHHDRLPGDANAAQLMVDTQRRDIVYLEELRGMQITLDQGDSAFIAAGELPDVSYSALAVVRLKGSWISGQLDRPKQTFTVYAEEDVTLLLGALS